MMRIDFSFAVTLFVSTVVLFFLIKMLFVNKCDKIKSVDNTADVVRVCPYCSCVSVNYFNKKLSICPVCKSYIEEITNENSNIA